MSFGSIPGSVRRWLDCATATPLDALAFVGWLAIWTSHISAVLGEHHLAVYADDFFYYVVPAEQLLARGIPTFDGIVATNGYQPLWFLVVTTLLALTGGEISHGFSVALQLVTTCLLAVAYLAAWDIARRMLHRASAATACALFWSIGCCWMSRDGMEAPLVLCFATLLLRRLLIQPLFEQGPRALVVTGILTSLMVLARLDSVLLVALLFLTHAVGTDVRRWKVIVPFFAAGGVLLPLYLLVNAQLFDSLLPVSGAAKQLKTTWVPSLDPMRFIRLAQVAPLYFAVWVVIAPTASALALRRRLEDSTTRRVVLAAAAFPLLFLAVHSILSDWLFWDWYAYPILVSLAVLVPATLAWMSGFVQKRVMRLVWLAVMLVPLVGFVVADGWRARYPFVEDARQLRPFLEAHDATYAMGDRAGAVRLLARRRVVQTEGLVMDRPFLDDIAQQRDLIEALRQRDVRYYVVNRPAAFEPATRDGCPVFEEPSSMVRGPSSAAMRGALCASPVLDLRTASDRRIRIYDLSLESDATESVW